MIITAEDIDKQQGQGILKIQTGDHTYSYALKDSTNLVYRPLKEERSEEDYIRIDCIKINSFDEVENILATSLDDLEAKIRALIDS